MKKKKIIWVIVIILCLFVLDRFFWMPERAERLWLNERGRNLGDPIAYNQDFTIEGNRILFKDNKDKENFPAVHENRKSEFYFAGCYFGSFYLYDLKRKELILYSSN